MKLLNLFRKKTDLAKLSPQEFDKALAVMGRYATELESEEVIAEMVKEGLTETKANELYLFMPAAFCRQLIPDLPYPDYYIDYYGEHKQVKRHYRDNPFYVAIETYTQAYFSQNPRPEQALAIVSAGAEFQGIQSLLSTGSQPKDIELSPTHIIR